MKSLVIGLVVGGSWYLVSGNLIGAVISGYVSVGLLKALLWQGAKESAHGYLLPAGIKKSTLTAGMLWPFFMFPNGDPVNEIYATMKRTDVAPVKNRHDLAINASKTKADPTLEARGAVEEVESRYNLPVVREITSGHRYALNHRKQDFLSLLDSMPGTTPREWVYSTLSNKIGDQLESGKFHVYRGALGKEGQKLLEVFDSCYDELLRMQAKEITLDYAESQKKSVA